MRRTTGEIGGACSAESPLPPFDATGFGAGSALAGAGASVSPPPPMPAPVSDASGPSSLACACPGFDSVSIRASTSPTGTVTPTSMRISVTRPATGDGISVSILSVEISQIVSSRSIQSPGFFFQSAMVPSATETPICGIVTSTLVLVGEELTSGLPHVVDLRQHGTLERRRERNRHVRRRDALDRSVQVLPRFVRDDRRDLRHDAGGAR